MNIIIAEDDAVASLLLVRTLEKAGHRVKSAPTGRSALELLRQQTFDILVTDFMMPEMDGIELIRRVRAEIRPSPAIIMCTARADSHLHEYALQSGADGFQAKPFRPEEMAELVANVGAMRTQLYVPADAPPQSAGRAADAQSIKRTAPPALVAVAVAASTGGPEALREFFATCPAVPNIAYLVTMHGPDWVQHACVRSLQTKVASLRFSVAETGALVQPGRVYYAPGDRHMLVSTTGQFIELSGAPPVNFVRPAADPLFHSVAEAFGSASAAVVLTGMGCDGAAGAREIARRGGRVFCQDPATAVAPRMPESAIRAAKEAEVLPLGQLSKAVGRYVVKLGDGTKACG